MFVALGAFFIAVKETWELCEIYHWPLIIFWLSIIFMLLGSAVNTIVRMRRTHAMLGEPEPGRLIRVSGWARGARSAAHMITPPSASSRSVTP